MRKSTAVIEAIQAATLGKLEIHVTHDIETMTDEAIAAVAKDPELYQRAGRLVHVVRSTGEPGAVTRCEGSPVIKTMERATLFERICSAADWRRWDPRRNEWRAGRPPGDVVAAVAARGEWPGIRPLVGVVEAPALRPSGTVIQERGYDAPTGYLYEPNVDYPAVPDAPTREDAMRARDELLETVCDFPFASNAHRAAWLAATLTLFARPAVQGCTPLVAIDATTRGTGKGKLADVMANLATGRDACKTTQPKDDDEMRKRITALVLEGEGIAVIDNVSRPLGDASLDAAITATRWQDRALGRNETISAPNRIQWVATGNNLQFAGDTARRTLHIRLESLLESPEDRNDFRHSDLLAWIRQERPRLVRAALTILRAFFAAGCPAVAVRNWGSFEEWSRIVAGAVVWVNMPDPQTTRLELEAAADTTKTALGALLAGWTRLTKDVPDGISVKAAIAALYPPGRMCGEAPPDGYDELREAIEELTLAQSGRPPSSQKLGYVMKRFRRRVIGGRMLDAILDRKGTAKWVVRGAGDAGDAGDVSNPSRGNWQKGNTEEGIRNMPGIPGMPGTGGQA